MLDTNATKRDNFSIAKGAEGIRTYSKNPNIIFRVFRRISKTFHLLRFRTTFKWHHKATRYKWYKRWHDFRFAHHFHIGILIIYVLGLMLGIFAPTPRTALASNGSWSQTTFNGTSDGTYTNTQAANGNVDVGLTVLDGTGGTITHSGGYTIHTFPYAQSGTSFTPPSGVTTVETLVVAGGGGGGTDAYAGGGGGGGGVVYNASFDVTALQAYPITVGAGGLGAINNSRNSGNGGNSVFSTITAIGGGRGGGRAGTIGGSGNGGDGGNGGGGKGHNDGVGNAGGTGSQGYNGGNGVTVNTGAGGGGGAAAAGNNGAVDTGAAGGVGLANPISGSSLTYSGGGGGWGWAAGGANGLCTSGYGCGRAGRSSGGAGISGLSGVVIIRYATIGYNTSGTYVSSEIPSAIAHQGKVYGWGDFTFTNTLGGQTITYDILNGATGNTIPGYTGITTSPTDLSSISSYTYPSLKLRANLSTADPAATPLLNDWAVAYTYDNTGPTGTVLSWGTVTSTAIDVAASGAVDNEAGLRGDNLTYYVERDDNATSFVSADANSGWITGTWEQSSLTANTAYSYRVKARDVLGNESEWVNPSPAYKYTLTNIPVLDPPTPHTEDPKPPVSNSAAPDLSIAGRPVKLYDDGSLVAETTANGSGVFTFAVGDYTSALSDGEHLNITARVLNGDNVESADSAPITIHVDTDPPSPPTTVDVAREGSAGGAEILDNAWNQHNNGAALYFEFSGATDLPIPPNTGIKRYWVYFGSNGSALPRTDGQATADSTLNVIKTLSSPVTGTDYYLRIQSEDEVGNISADGSVTTLFTYKFDNTPPTAVPQISVSPAGWGESDPFTFTWSAGTDGDSGIYGYDYKRSNGTDDWTRLASASPNTVQADHYQTGVNYLLIRTVDNAGNTSGNVTWPYLYSGSVGAPQNLQVDLSQSQGQTVNNFKFTWDPPLVGNTVGYYYSVNSAPTPENSTYVTDDFTPFGSYALLNNQANTFYVVAKDEYGNIGWNNSASTQFFVNTVSPGVPQNVTITDSSNRATENWALTVSWDALTGQPPGFDGYEIWRCTANCGDDLNFNDKRATVSTNIYSEASLSNVTDYYYKIKSKDSVSNTSAFSSGVNKIPTGRYTVPPTFTSGPNVTAKASEATITWTTDRPSSSKVYYSTGSVSCPGTGFGSDTPVTDHTVDLSGLTPGVVYKYKIQSLDEHRDYLGGDGDACSAENTLTTLAAPGISDVTVSEIRLTTAIISWKTTSSATSKILYGTSTAYGQTYTDNSGSQTTTHTVQLSGLSDSTTYNFKIQGTDVDGNPLQSDNYVFTTLTFPRLSGLSVEQVKNSPTSTVKVAFVSNVPITAQVNVSGDGGKSASTYDLKTNHEITIVGLKDNTEYTVTVQGRDQYGNNANSLSKAYKTQFDTRPPEISDITTETEIVGFGVDAKGQIIVSWTTDEPATSQVEYGSGATGTDYASTTQEDSALTENHVVIISDLKTSAPYHFRVISKDNASNEAKSDNNSVLTNQASESIIDLIIKSLQSTIGWIFNVFNR